MKTHIATEADFRPEAAARSPAYQAYQLLHWGFVAAPLLAGVDKFLMVLTDWTQYLWGPLASLAGTGQRFMHIAGVIEIAAGLLVAWKPRIGGYVVALWLWGIILNLLLLRSYLDIALRDFGLSLGALALARLALYFDHPVKVESTSRVGD